jgi:bifunctional enzyme CysN/CysC
VSIKEVLAANERKDLLRLLTAGSVDDSKLVYEDHLKTLERDSKKVGSAGDEIDYSLLTDGLKAEREQGITIDVAYRYFSTPRRKFIIADCPGHEQYTRNMATGASTANLAIILIDARKGVIEQTRRHSFIASLLDIGHVVVAVNKMDLVDYSQEVFDRICADYTDFAARLKTRDVRFIPISALVGDNVVERSDNMPWFRGVPLLDYLESVHIASDRNLIDLRFPVQYVLRPDMGFRGYCGTVASGTLRKGAEVVVLPSGKRSRVKSIATYDGEHDEVFAPMSVTVCLEDEIDVSRGDQLVYPGNLPRLDREFDAVLVWMAEAPLSSERGYRIKHGTSVTQAQITNIEYKFDVNTLHRQPAERLELNDIGRVRIHAAKPLAFDPYLRNHATGSFIVIDTVTNNTVAAGMILDRRSAAGDRGQHVSSRASQIALAERADRLRQNPATIWLTGLPKSGKSTVGYALEKRLFAAGHHVHVLDGGNLRHGISADLGFSARERSENARRASYLARVCNEAGLITVAALTSPFASDREAARAVIGADRFYEIHLSAPAAACEARDDEGLYAKARRGEIAHFTGVSAPYEQPTAPDLVIPTHEVTIDDAVDRIVTLLRDRGVIRG